MGHAVSTPKPFLCEKCELQLWLSPGPDKKREFFGVKKEWVVPFDLIPIIDAGAQPCWVSFVTACTFEFL